MLSIVKPSKPWLFLLASVNASHLTDLKYDVIVVKMYTIVKLCQGTAKSTILSILNSVQFVCCSMPYQQYFNYIVAVI